MKKISKLIENYRGKKLNFNKNLYKKIFKINKKINLINKKIIKKLIKINKNYLKIN